MIQQSIDLSEYTTFGVHTIASEFARFDSIERLITIINSRPNRSLLLLGGGSNLLATKDIDALVLKNEINGIKLTEETENHVVVECGALWLDRSHTLSANCFSYIYIYAHKLRDKNTYN